jgi:predicted O-methyltransferase YrrM
MRLDEIAFLWRSAQAADKDTVVEIGRERGGSTIVLASAMAPENTLWSCDPQTKHGDSDHDRELSALLVRLGLSDQVCLVSEDSHLAEPPPGDYGLVLIDGDPTIEGTRLDFETYAMRLRVGGLALLHDATPGAPRATQLAPLLVELEAAPAFTRRPDVGTFAVFARNSVG